MSEISTVVDTKKRGLSLNGLKYIAIIAMFIEHFTDLYISSMNETIFEVINSVGRITAPIMFYALVEGYHKTKNRKVYFLRLLFFAILSYFPFIYMRSGGDLQYIEFHRLNVIFTILIGFAAIHIRRNITSFFLQIPLIIALLLLSIPTDWGTSGVMIMLIFDYYYGSRSNQLFGYLLWVLFQTFALGIFTQPFENWIFLEEGLHFEFKSSYIRELAYLVPMILIAHYNGEKGNNSTFSKYVFYVFYPVHMFLIGLMGVFLTHS